MYLLFLICLAHAVRRSKQAVSYLLGGLAFGLLLEYIEVLTGSYTYGRFFLMLGKAPLDIPLCIGVGWGIILYTSRLFSDSLRLALWACVALDTLLALNIDLSMDAVAYRLHMWHWNWVGTGLDPLKAQWFGIPYGNFVGWQTVVFCYSAFSRLFERLLSQRSPTLPRVVLVTVLALVCSQAVLFITETWLYGFLGENFGITSAHRFAGAMLVLALVALRGWFRRAAPAGPVPALAWWVPGWFHLFFFACFYLLGFYAENSWLTVVAWGNLLVGIALHVLPWLAKSASAQPASPGLAA